MHQVGILTRATVVIVLAVVAATLLAPRSAPASGFHATDPSRAAIDLGPVSTRLRASPPAVLHKTPLRIPPAEIDGLAHRVAPVLIVPIRPQDEQDKMAAAKISDKA